MASVEFKDVQIAYGNTIVVDHFHLNIAEGEFAVLVGPSGCGKSTILRSIAGLENARGGELKVGERTVNDVDPAQRDIAMVFQNYALYPHMTIFDNIAFGMRLRREKKDEIARKVQEVASLVDLTAHLGKKPGALSGGQRQRAALARAIVRHPGVFLFDEPLSNLDADFRAAMRTELIKLHRQLRSTMIYVTHDQVEAMTMGDKIAVLAPIALAQGKSNLMQYGTPTEIYERPENLFVARFVGSPRMNIIEAQVADAMIDVGGFSVTVTSGSSALEQVSVGIRPEHMSIVNEDTAGIPAEVDTVENLGHEQVISFTSPHGPIVMRREAGGKPLKFGEKVRLSAPAGKLHIFDTANGQRADLSLA